MATKQAPRPNHKRISKLGIVVFLGILVVLAGTACTLAFA